MHAFTPVNCPGTGYLDSSTSVVVNLPRRVAGIALLGSAQSACALVLQQNVLPF